MDKNNIQEYAKLMKELGLTGLEITEDNKTIRLEMQPAQSVETKIIKEEAVKTANEPSAKPSSNDGLTDIISPMVGVFYAAPTEDSDPFVKVGDKVKKGDTICIIEAMKLMNEITAETDGVIKEVCVQNQQAVEYGTVLFRIEA